MAKQSSNCFVPVEYGICFEDVLQEMVDVIMDGITVRK